MLYTRRGDDGYTDLLGGERVPKESARIGALGDLDEATSALGLGRAFAQQPETKHALLHVQKDLYLLMADLATVAGRMVDQPRLTDDAVQQLEGLVAEFEERVTLGREFVAPGDTVPGAAIDVARAIVRRAERTVTLLFHEEDGANKAMVTYLNRLSSLLFVVARFEDAGFGQTPTITKAIKE